MDNLEYQTSLEKYEEILELKNGSELVQLDNEVENMRQQIKKQQNKYKFTTDDLVTLMKWKLKRGQFRPKLQQLAASNKSENVQEAFDKAYNIIHSKNKNQESNNLAGQAMQELIVLAGVGPATASKILSIMDDKIPFMSDEALKMCDLQLVYSKPQYMKLYVKMNEKIEKITKQQKIDLTVNELEKVYWVQVQEPKLKNKKQNKQQDQKKKKKVQKKEVIEIEDDSDEQVENNKKQVTNKKKLKKK